MGEVYLEHHGILGMHWGIRRYQNLDGSLTEEGRQRLRKDINAARKKSSGTTKSISAEVSKIDGVKEIVQKYDQVMGEKTKALNDNIKIINNAFSGIDYEKSSLASCIYNSSSSNIGETTAGQAFEYSFGYVNDDLDQGDRTASFFHLARKNDSEFNKVMDAIKVCDDFETESLRERNKIIEEYIGSYKDIPVGNLRSEIVNANFAIQDVIDSTRGFHERTNYYTYGMDYSDRTNLGSAREANYYADKLNIHGFRQYSNLYDAIENLGYSGTKLKDLSDADWKAISDECKK